MTKEKLAEKIFKECLADGEEVTMEEALEMAEMEIKAKGIKNYTTTEKSKNKGKREVKLDDDKVGFITHLVDLLDDELEPIENLTIANPQREITFTLKGAEYSLVLTKHRPKKK